MSIIKPPVLPAWADAGDKIQPTSAEVATGWPVSNIPPSRQRFNWILNYLANGVRYFSRRGLPDYDPLETYMIGDCIIGDDGNTYKSLVDNNTAKTPSTSATKWVLWGFTASQLGAYLTTGLSKVAFSGSYADLSNKPTIPTIPTLAAVATSGSYADLSNKPTIPTIPTLAAVATSGSYADLSNKPTAQTIPTKVSQLSNDSGFLTASSTITAYNAVGSYVLAGSVYANVYPTMYQGGDYAGSLLNMMSISTAPMTDGIVGSALPGTWRYMSATTSPGAGGHAYGGLFCRVA